MLGTSNPLGTFTPTYEGLTGRVDFVQQSLGLKVDFAWEPTGERRLTGIANTWGAGNTPVSGFGYGYSRNGANDPTGQIHQWTHTSNGAFGWVRMTALGYDEVDQLTDATRTEPGGPVLGKWAYRYDKSGIGTAQVRQQGGERFWRMGRQSRSRR